MHRPTRFATLLLAIALSPLAAAATPGIPIPASSVTPSPPPSEEFPIKRLRGLLVDAKGRALYTWDGDDQAGRSKCNNQCRLLWPPITATDSAQPRGGFGLITRDDGVRQWTFRGKPLYRWVSDRKFGDAGGDGVAGAWHLVRVGPAEPTGSKP